MNHPRSLLRSMSLAFALLPLFTAAQAATTLDPAFANNGRYIVTTPAQFSYFRTIAHLPKPGGGSVAVVHYRRTTSNPGDCPAERDCIGLYPFNAAGTMTGALTVPITLNFSIVSDAAIDSQGRIVVVGSVLHSGSDHDFRIVRILPNGTADTSFSTDGMVNVAFDLGGDNYDRANAVTVDSQGRILVAGIVQRATAGDYDFGIARLTTSGVLDPSFNGNGKRQIAFDLETLGRRDEATAIAVGNDEKIVVGGSAKVEAGLFGRSRIGLARLLTDGSYDTSFCNTSCNDNPYPGIHSGRRVIYAGQWNDADSDGLSALAIAPSGRFVTAGKAIETGAGGTSGAYVQVFENNGNWQYETISDGGVAGDPNAFAGGIHYVSTSPTSDIVLTGVSGPSMVLFFAQRLTYDLYPVTNWGYIGNDNSVYLWAGGSGFGDAEFNQTARSSIDPQGRILTGGSFKPTTSSPYSAAIARLTAGTTPQGPSIFSNGFE